VVGRQGAVEAVVIATSTFWQDRRVLVTGHTGFKGGWLSLWLQRLGAQVTGYALAPATQPNLFESAGVASGMQSCVGDIRDFDRLAEVAKVADPEVVFHLAAQSLVRVSYQRPLETYATNVMGTATLLEVARQLPSLRAVVVVTSDKCYDNRDWPWGYREDDVLGGRDPYSSSKACAELVTAAYRHSFIGPLGERADIGLATARAGNVIGGGDWSPDRLVPDMARAFAHAAPVVVRHPQSVRPWQHVLEPLQGYMILAERLASDPVAYAGAWNFGPGDEDAWSVEKVVACAARLWGGDARWTTEPRDDAPHEAAQLRLDSSKARQALGWEPGWPIREALERTVRWYQAHARDDDMRARSLEQIAAFSSAAVAADD
jgi:CDP-glucose 4,6-dehydratase